MGLSLVGARHAARLRGAITGKDKSEVIDADVLAMAADVFALTPLRVPSPEQLALRRAVTRRGKLVVDGNRAKRRLISLARWAFPDVWTAFAGSMPTATAVLTRWPNLNSLPTARRQGLTAVVAGHTRGVPDVPARVEAIRAAAAAWAAFWAGHLDLDALAWEVTEPLADLRASGERIARATEQVIRYWAPAVRRRPAARLAARDGLDDRTDRARLPRRRDRVQHGEGRRVLRRDDPVE
ncbi:MAG TPA: transposase, partial [Intrasporangium sp.]|nr:transposase [Intrasporangium sp.]